MDRLEVDERAMMELAALPILFTVPSGFLGGLLLGLVYFKALRTTADLIVDSRQPHLGLLLSAGRLGILGAGFYIAVLAGGPALLSALAGVVCVKAVMLAQARGELT